MLLNFPLRSKTRIKKKKSRRNPYDFSVLLRTRKFGDFLGRLFGRPTCFLLSLMPFLRCTIGLQKTPQMFRLFFHTESGCPSVLIHQACCIPANCQLRSRLQPARSVSLEWRLILWVSWVCRIEWKSHQEKWFVLLLVCFVRKLRISLPSQVWIDHREAHKFQCFSSSGPPDSRSAKFL